MTSRTRQPVGFHLFLFTAKYKCCAQNVKMLSLQSSIPPVPITLVWTISRPQVLIFGFLLDQDLTTPATKEKRQCLILNSGCNSVIRKQANSQQMTIAALQNMTVCDLYISSPYCDKCLQIKRQQNLCTCVCDYDMWKAPHNKYNWGITAFMQQHLQFIRNVSSTVISETTLN